MVWNALSFWDGQPVTSPVYPQMGDLLNPNTSGYQGMQHPLNPQSPFSHHQNHQQNHHNHQTHQHHSNPLYYMRMGGGGMGDFRQMSCPMPNYMPQFREPCLDDTEAYYAYNGVDSSREFGAGLPPSGGGAGGAFGARGDFW
ncbi:protein SHORT-ROOT 2 [Drosophila ficusphila]|uniref:protein SHORT-ROOT 2 n=1 Tax=Drosophila ficusphila TaxID=30025 RepID=UPI0007E88DC4|nr:protein SHORT-ROOT 2 [Drosophila ficusphila]